MLFGLRQITVTLTQEEGLDISINRISLWWSSQQQMFLTSSLLASEKKKVSSGVEVLKKIRPFVLVSNLTTSNTQALWYSHIK